MSIISQSIDDPESHALARCENTDVLVVAPELPTPYPNGAALLPRFGFPGFVGKCQTSPHPSITRRAGT